ncbi:MAG: transposase [Candidatus Lambdaproteobacteria bacterium]|nr:transposase [Candidatus Lambdaproteobacteria bacterium]
MMERLQFDLAFRWFVGLGMDDPVRDATGFTTHRDRLLEGEVARVAIAEMHRQVGPLRFAPDGLAERGVLLRHLAMPGYLAETRAILHWIAAELSPATYANLMDQYRPAFRALRYSEIARRLDPDECEHAREIARQEGLTRLDARAPPWFFARGQYGSYHFAF